MYYNIGLEIMFLIIKLMILLKSREIILIKIMVLWFLFQINNDSELILNNYNCLILCLGCNETAREIMALYRENNNNFITCKNQNL